jgi:hypothetical protein
VEGAPHGSGGLSPLKLIARHIVHIVHFIHHR